MRSLFLFLTFLLICPVVEAQSNTVSAFGGGSILTGGPDGGYLLGTAYERSFNSWLGLEVEAQLTRGRNTNELALLNLDYYELTHATAAINVLAMPVRFRAFGAEHRLGLAGGPALRYKDEQLDNAMISDGVFDLLEEGERERIPTEWEELGERWRAVWVEWEGDPRSPEAWLRESGTHLVLTFPNTGFDIGLAAGLAYELRIERTVIGARALYRRYRDQKMLTGSHALDVSLRVGYRF